jgi:mercuric ion binding protein
MKRLLYAIPLAALIFGLVTPVVLAASKTVVLAVENMYCSACPHIVKQPLLAVPGVDTEDVSFEKKTAAVKFDDATPNVDALTAAIKKAGYPSHVAP